MTKRIVIEKTPVKNVRIAAIFSAFACLFVAFLAIGQFASMFNKESLVRVEQTFTSGHDSFQAGLDYAKSIPVSIPDPAEIIDYATETVEHDLQHVRVQQAVLDQMAQEVISTSE